MAVAEASVSRVQGGGVHFISLDRDREASRDLNRLLDKPGSGSATQEISLVQVPRCGAFKPSRSIGAERQEGEIQPPQ